MIDEEVKEEEIEVDLTEESEADDAPVQENKAEDTEVEQLEETPVEAEGEEKKPRSTKFQKRIDDLTHKQREAERQRDEYYNVANKVMEENKRLREQASQFGQLGSTEMEGRLNSQAEAAKAAYKKAYEEGDADAIVSAQEAMIQASTGRQQAAQVKRAAESIQNQSQIDLAPPPNSKAVEWANRNSWFNKDMIMTNAAYTIHDELMRSGVKGDSPEYYSALDARMQQEFPQKFSGTVTTEQPREKNVNSVVTPAGNQASKSRKVRLTPSQVAVAKRLGVPIEEYAKQFIALNS